MAERTAEQSEYWLLYFEDADRVDELFTDEICARTRHAACLNNWNCHLFQQAGPIEDLAQLRKDAERWRKLLAETLREKTRIKVGNGRHVDQRELFGTAGRCDGLKGR